MQRQLLHAADSCRRRIPAEVEHGRRDVDDVVELPAGARPPASPAGQCMINGARMPPPKVYFLYILSGVLPACAQPDG